MLFSYAYIPHSMEIMQVYIDFIFYEVWCEAKGKDYNIDILFADLPELKEIVTELHTSEYIGANFFLTGLQQVFEDFKTLADGDITQIKKWYESNNCIEQLCDNDPTVTPATYKIIAASYPDLSKHLYKFFKNLYSNDFLSLKSIKGRIGHIDEHYKYFIKENSKGKCPFCGIQDIKGLYHTKREAYDHYLPKSIYPFVSINFRNLAPACHECNSTYKLTKNPAYEPKSPTENNGGARRKAFYPYASNEHTIQLSIEVKTTDWTHLQPDDVSLLFGPEAIKEQIDTWLDVYGIEERFKAKCCEENDGIYWIKQVQEEWQEDGRTPDEFLHTLGRLADRNPYAETNFLKKSFLEGCQQAGLFDE